VAASAAAGLPPNEAALSRLARRGSGSASRSVPNGFCDWVTGNNTASYAVSLAPAEHWDLWDVVAVVSRAHKAVGSAGGHPLAQSSSLQPARVAVAADRLAACRRAILARDLAALGPVMEEDAVIMHAVMMTSRPPLYYWAPATMALILAVQQWREEGLPVYFTIDAGPNVHLMCEAAHVDTVSALARKIPGVQTIITSGPGGPARLLG
jgi:diphosphomevalonate decarboxylase